MKTDLKKSRTYASVDALVLGLGLPRTIRTRVARLNVSTRVIDRLVLERTRTGLTQAVLARRMGCTQSRISKLEDSTDANLTLGEINAYCAALGVSANLSVL